MMAPQERREREQLKQRIDARLQEVRQLSDDILRLIFRLEHLKEWI